MKRFTIIAGCVLLAACGSKNEAPADPAASGSASAAATAAAANYAPPAGSYDVTRPDGSKGVTTLVADGNFVDRDDKDKVTDKGKWTMTDGKLCFASEKGETTCYAKSAPGADGSFTATDPKGALYQVKPHTK